MALLYPPYLEGTIPAQVGDTLRIPYQLNRAQGPADLINAVVSARVKTVSTNKMVFDEDLTTDFKDSNTDIYYANFTIDAEKLKVGQYYKIQLAFSERGSIATYYSTIAIFKYTKTPKVTIKNYELNGANGATFSWTGLYETEDILERVKEYKFNIWKNDELYYTTGWKIHNVKEDTVLGKSEDFCELNHFINNQRYYVQYFVKTLNDLTVSSPRYSFMHMHLKKEHTGEYAFNLITEVDSQRGCVILKTSTKHSWSSGRFWIVRRFSDSDQWTKIGTILIDGELDEDELFSDYDVEQGKSYRYAIFQLSDTAPVMGYLLETENDVYIDFEDMLLYDGERQLSIRYNPKISKFKTTLIESKIDTLGNRYPKFLKNGNVNYKDFSIEGLISYSMDDNNDFIINNTTEPYRNSTASNDIIKDTAAKEMQLERDFKLTVLNWLNNGKPKLFRSGPEGNYIVRLMNISLTPNDTLGRRLHTFQATAYEIDELNYDNLVKYGFVNNEYKKMGKLHFNIVNSFPVEIPPSSYARLYNVPEGSIFKLTFANKDSYEIQIGRSEQYNVFINENNLLIKCEKISGENRGHFEYGYNEAPQYKITTLNNKEITKYTNILFVDQILNGLQSPLTDLYCCKIQQKNIIPFNSSDQNFTFRHQTSLYQDENNHYYYLDNNGEKVKIDDIDSMFKITIEDKNLYYNDIIFDQKDPRNIGDSVQIFGRAEYGEQELKNKEITFVGVGLILDCCYIKEIYEHD